MTTADWRAKWDRAAEAESKRYDAVPVASLILDIRAGRIGRYHSIWYSLARRSSLIDAGWTLFNVLESRAPYLVRYHCAAALVMLLDGVNVKPVELSASRFPLSENLARVGHAIEMEIGSPTSDAKLTSIARLRFAIGQTIRRIGSGKNCDGAA
jgi:hypothetical protein